MISSSGDLNYIHNIMLDIKMHLSKIGVDEIMHEYGYIYKSIIDSNYKDTYLRCRSSKTNEFFDCVLYRQRITNLIPVSFTLSSITYSMNTFTLNSSCIAGTHFVENKESGEDKFDSKFRKLFWRRKIKQ